VSLVSLSSLRADFHRSICARLLTLDDKGVATNADGGQRTSVAIAKSIADQLGAKPGTKLAGQTAGVLFEAAVTDFVNVSFARLQHIRPGQWTVECVSARNDLIIARYEQYAHLAEVKRIASESPELAVFVGNDYNVASDVVVARRPLDDATISKEGLVLDRGCATRTPLRAGNSSLPIMHASISCKWTMRSDRAQNSRFEALNLIRSRKGRVPHIVVVTGEPSPSRLASLALGTGDIDCVYHFALPELRSAVGSLGQDELESLLNIMVSGNRLRDISDLPLDLAI
jgi:NgoMIV restriction enzyme